VDDTLSAMNLITEKARQALMHRRESLRALLHGSAALDNGLREGWRQRLEVFQALGAPQGVSEQQGLSEQDVRELAEIDAALERIDAGQFGRCERCGGAIGLQRLRAVPEARLCISCSSGF
jgi:RNA polymerase-binding transcription factor DksA